jgi:hypothetical protein
MAPFTRIPMATITKADWVRWTWYDATVHGDGDAWMMIRGPLRTPTDAACALEEWDTVAPDSADDDVWCRALGPHRD